MTVAPPHQLRADLVRLAHRGTNVRDFTVGAARILARCVPFDGVCVLTMDTATLVPTGEFAENCLPRAATVRMAEIEMSGEDVNHFGAIALSGRGSATLAAVTDGDLDRSRRGRELLRPNGVGDELRAVLATDSRTWGALTLLRSSDRVTSPLPTRPRSPRSRTSSPLACARHAAHRGLTRGSPRRRDFGRSRDARPRQLGHLGQRRRGALACRAWQRTGRATHFPRWLPR
jgi:hypothetical protein